MRRFARNRWLAFVLVLSVLLVSSTTIVPSSFGHGIDSLVFGGGADGGSSGGDPDGPAGPSKRTPPGRRVAAGGNGYASTSVGDGGQQASIWVWRFQVVVRSLTRR